MGGVLGLLPQGGLVLIPQVDRRVIGRDEAQRRVPLDQREEPFSNSQKLSESFLGRPRGIDDAEGVAAIVTVGRPGPHQLRIERGLSTQHGRGADPRRLPGDGVGAGGFGEIVVKGQPEAGAGSRGAPAGGDSLGVEVPVSRLAADKLQGPGGVVQARLDRRLYPLLDGVLNEPIFDAYNRQVGRQQFREKGREFAEPVAAPPAAAVDEKDHRRRVLGRRSRRLPDVQNLLGMRSVGDIGKRRGR